MGSRGIAAAIIGVVEFGEPRVRREQVTAETCKPIQRTNPTIMIAFRIHLAQARREAQSVTMARREETERYVSRRMPDRDRLVPLKGVPGRYGHDGRLRILSPDWLPLRHGGSNFPWRN